MFLYEWKKNLNKKLKNQVEKIHKCLQFSDGSLGDFLRTIRNPTSKLISKIVHILMHQSLKIYKKNYSTKISEKKTQK